MVSPFSIGSIHAALSVRYDVVCSYTVEDYETLVSSPCLSSAKNMVRSVEWSLECNEIKEEFACNINDHCYW